MDLVIITFSKDLYLCKWQLRTIKKFLEPCTIHIVVNEQDHSHASYYLKEEVELLENHVVHFWSRTKILGEVPDNINGWISQQLLKLLLPIDKDYIVLDCKDMFIRPTMLNDLIKEHYRNQSNVKICKTWKYFSNKLLRRLNDFYGENINHKDIRDIQTPRLIKKSIRKKILEIFKNKQHFIDWFLTMQMPSEFILYDAVRLYEKEMTTDIFPKKEIIGVWNMKMYGEIDLNNLPEETRIVKLHRRLYDDSKIRKRLDKWLTSKLTEVKLI